MPPVSNSWEADVGASLRLPYQETRMNTRAPSEPLRGRFGQRRIQSAEGRKLALRRGLVARRAECPEHLPEIA